MTSSSSRTRLILSPSSSPPRQSTPRCLRPSLPQRLPPSQSVCHLLPGPLPQGRSSRYVTSISIPPETHTPIHFAIRPLISRHPTISCPSDSSSFHRHPPLKMLTSLARPAFACPARQARLFSDLASAATSAAKHPAPSDALPQPASAPASQLPYLVRRNTKGSIPVYTDIRNGGTRYLVLIRNVEGNADVRPTSDSCRALLRELTPVTPSLPSCRLPPKRRGPCFLYFVARNTKHASHSNSICNLYHAPPPPAYNLSRWPPIALI